MEGKQCDVDEARRRAIIKQKSIQSLRQQRLAELAKNGEIDPNQEPVPALPRFMSNPDLATDLARRPQSPNPASLRPRPRQLKMPTIMGCVPSQSPQNVHRVELNRDKAADATKSQAPSAVSKVLTRLVPGKQRKKDKAAETKKPAPKQPAVQPKSAPPSAPAPAPEPAQVAGPRNYAVPRPRKDREPRHRYRLKQIRRVSDIVLFPNRPPTPTPRNRSSSIYSRDSNETIRPETYARMIEEEKRRKKEEEDKRAAAARAGACDEDERSEDKNDSEADQQSSSIDTYSQSHTLTTSPTLFDTTKTSESLCLETPSSGVAYFTAKQEEVTSNMVSEPEWCVTNPSADDVADVIHETQPETRDSEQLSAPEHEVRQQDEENVQNRSTEERNEEEVASVKSLASFKSVDLQSETPGPPDQPVSKTAGADGDDETTTVACEEVPVQPVIEQRSETGVAPVLEVTLEESSRPAKPEGGDRISSDHPRTTPIPTRETSTTVASSVESSTVDAGDNKEEAPSHVASVTTQPMDESKAVSETRDAGTADNDSNWYRWDELPDEPLQRPVAFTGDGRVPWKVRSQIGTLKIASDAEKVIMGDSDDEESVTGHGDESTSDDHEKKDQGDLSAAAESNVTAPQSTDESEPSIHRKPLSKSSNSSLTSIFSAYGDQTSGVPPVPQTPAAHQSHGVIRSSVSQPVLSSTQQTPSRVATQRDALDQTANISSLADNGATTPSTAASSPFPPRSDSLTRTQIFTIGGMQTPSTPTPLSTENAMPTSAKSLPHTTSYTSMPTSHYANWEEKIRKVNADFAAQSTGRSRLPEPKTRGVIDGVRSFFTKSKPAIDKSMIRKVENQDETAFEQTAHGKQPQQSSSQSGYPAADPPSCPGASETTTRTRRGLNLKKSLRNLREGHSEEVAPPSPATFTTPQASPSHIHRSEVAAESTTPASTPKSGPSAIPVPVSTARSNPENRTPCFARSTIATRVRAHVPSGNKARREQREEATNAVHVEQSESSSSLIIDRQQPHMSTVTAQGSPSPVERRQARLPRRGNAHSPTVTRPAVTASLTSQVPLQPRSTSSSQLPIPTRAVSAQRASATRSVSTPQNSAPRLPVSHRPVATNRPLPPTPHSTAQEIPTANSNMPTIARPNGAMSVNHVQQQAQSNARQQQAQSTSHLQQAQNITNQPQSGAGTGVNVGQALEYLEALQIQNNVLNYMHADREVELAEEYLAKRKADQQTALDNLMDAVQHFMAQHARRD